jgi:hypothetical protein
MDDQVTRASSVYEDAKARVPPVTCTGLGLSTDDNLPLIEPFGKQESNCQVNLDVMETAEPELIDVARGLWIWQVEYREWPRDQGWDGKVISTCVESGSR